jgi:hypothetical protein
MRIIIFFFLIIFYVSGQAQENLQITSKSIGNVFLGDTIASMSKKLPKCKLIKAPSYESFIGGEGYGYLIVNNQTDTLIYIWSKDYGKTVGGIICLSERYSTKDKIRVGITLGEIEKHHSNIVLKPDYNSDLIENCTIRYESGFINAQIINKNQNLTGIYDSTIIDEPSTNNFERSTKIDRILIWK